MFDRRCLLMFGFFSFCSIFPFATGATAKEVAAADGKVLAEEDPLSPVIKVKEEVAPAREALSPAEIKTILPIKPIIPIIPLTCPFIPCKPFQDCVSCLRFCEPTCENPRPNCFPIILTATNTARAVDVGDPIPAAAETNETNPADAGGKVAATAIRPIPIPCRRCKCKPGYYRNSQGNCVRYWQCFQCPYRPCGPNEVCVSCFHFCEPTCQNPHPNCYPYWPILAGSATAKIASDYNETIDADDEAIRSAPIPAAAETNGTETSPDGKVAATVIRPIPLPITIPCRRCKCKPGYYRNSQGRCVLYWQCYPCIPCFHPIPFPISGPNPGPIKLAAEKATVETEPAEISIYRPCCPYVFSQAGDPFG